MVHFKLTAAAAALLAPMAMGAAPACGATDMAVIKITDHGTTALCAKGTNNADVASETVYYAANAGTGTSNHCYNIAASKYAKFTVGTTGIITISQYTDNACSVAGSPATVTRVSHSGTAVAATDCITVTATSNPAVPATDTWFGDTASNLYTYEVTCGTGTALLSMSSGTTSHTQQGCGNSATTAVTDGTDNRYGAPMIASLLGECVQTAAATSVQYKCSAAGGLTTHEFGNYNCNGTVYTTKTASSWSWPSTNANVPTGATGTPQLNCSNGCDWVAGSTCYTALTSTELAATTTGGRKTGTSVCVSIDNTPAPSSAPASPASIASAALAAVVGLGYLFF